MTRPPVTIRIFEGEESGEPDFVTWDRDDDGKVTSIAIGPIEEPPIPVTRAARAPSRQGMVQLSGFIPEQAKHELDVHAKTHRRTIQSIVEQMYNWYATEQGLRLLSDFAREDVDDRG